MEIYVADLRALDNINIVLACISDSLVCIHGFSKKCQTSILNRVLDLRSQCVSDSLKHQFLAQKINARRETLKE